MTRTKLAICLGLSTLAVAGCDQVFEELLAAFADLNILGVMPADGYSDPNSADYGRVKMALGGEGEDGEGIAPPGDDIEIEPDDGSDVEEGDWEVVPGYFEGSFVLLMDGSGSVEATDQCDMCPTDPNRLRVEAAKALALELGACSDNMWRMSLMEFGGESTAAGMSSTDTLADWTTDAQAVADAADGLGSYLGTPLWNSTFEVISALTEDVGDAYYEPGDEPTDPVRELPDEIGVGLVVISDGEDTESTRGLEEVIDKALEAGIPVHTIGFGPASDSVDEYSNSNAVADLRTLADATGGYYGFVETVDDLPELTRAIAGAMCGGHTELYATFTEPAASGERVTGQVRLAGTPLSVPFAFRAP